MVQIVVLSWMVALASVVSAGPTSTQANDESIEATNGRQANEALNRSRRFVLGWLRHADLKTGLIPRNLEADKDIWNAKDSAADNYPFMVLTCALTDEDMFRGRMLEMLRTETKLCSRVDRLPDTWNFVKQGFDTEKIDLDAVIFGSAEYCKDGLMPLTEWLGPSPWSERLIGILDDLWKHAPVETPFGKIPSTNSEVNGGLLQVLCRVFWMTGDRKYLDWAERLGDYYLLGEHHPTRDEATIKLRDHGSEIVGGLSELYLTTHYADREKKNAYREPLHEMLDRILEVGRNEHGLFYNQVDLNTGKPLLISPGTAMVCDTWGYVCNAYYTVYLVDKTRRYHEAVLVALGNLNTHYKGYDWERGSADGIADSVEGAINLLNRELDDSAPAWIEHEIDKMFAIQKEDGVIEGWHGDGNFARTAAMYALWKSQGATVRPWREDVCLGAVRTGRTLSLSLSAARPWKGRIVFDRPRHREYLRLPVDYPRINQFPEWYTVGGDTVYEIQTPTDGQTLKGRQLWEGLPVELTKGRPALRITVQSKSSR
ncbi:MAG TPA: hypothetical protein VLM89_15845 [Phycisphaerae bacterium]|nr:hypothetical protein [Phycisphaerae bacterium]